MMITTIEPRHLRQQARGMTDCVGVDVSELTPACHKVTKRYPQGRTGTEAGYAAHRAAGEKACALCLHANNKTSDARRLKAEKSVEYQERRRARSREANRRYAEANPERASNSAALSRAAGREIIREAKNRPCADCGTQYPYYVMQFDHLDPSEKSFAIGIAATRSPEVLRAEIAKCEVVCANCHAERTHQQWMAKAFTKEVSDG